MPETPLDLSKARILISNDDGIRARGIELLERVARTLSDDVWVVAPDTEQSGTSHSLTLRQPLRIRRQDERHFAVEGTPTDSVLLAVRHILKDHPPDLVLSGVNRGGNLGEDVTYSGTVAAAMEATLLGIPSIALSLHMEPASRPKWATAEHHAADVIRKVTAAPWPPNVFINVNFPDVPPDAVTGIQVVVQGRHKIGDHLEERFDPRGVPYYWVGPLRTEEPTVPDSDIAAVKEGAIALTPMHLDLTHMTTLRTLQQTLR